MILTLKRQPGQKTWCAELTGPSRKYGFEREFLSSIAGKAELCQYVIDKPGVYQWCELGECQFGIYGENGKLRKCGKKAVFKALGRIQAEARRKDEEVDQRIARFNSEGGFTLSDN